MPRFEVSEGIAFGLRLVDYLIAELMLNASLTSGSATSATFSSGTSTLTISGENLVFGTDPDDPSLLSGTLTEFRYTYQPGYWVDYSDLSIDLETLADAARAEQDGTDTAAFENLLYPLDWVIVSNSQSDSFPQNHVSYDGNPIAYTGDNFVWLDLGNDTFDASNGNDTVRAGIGHDTVWGGRGNDILLGQGGNDMLNGQAGNDQIDGGSGDDTILGMGGNDDLSGGIGNDILRGGGGNDMLRGDDGNDVLIGGTGADVFYFTEGADQQRDVIRDFEVGVDMISIQTASPVNYVETAAGFNIVTGTLTVHVRGLDLDDLAPDSIDIVPLV